LLIVVGAPALLTPAHAETIGVAVIDKANNPFNSNPSVLNLGSFISLVNNI